MAIKAGSWSIFAPLPLRLILGFGLIYHGAPKLFTSSGHAMIQTMLTDLRIPAPGIMSWVVGIVEFFGGLAILLGAFVSLAALLAIINMLVAMFKVHLAAGFSFMNITGRTEGGGLQFGMPGYEVNLLYIAGLAALAIGGAGPFSVDHYLDRTVVRRLAQSESDTRELARV
jgi:putative oxidoreductase